MTIWPARLSKDGTKVLCGRTVDGRQNCTEVLAVIQYGAPWGASVLFHGFYEEPRPQEPGEPIYGGPTYLRIGTYAAKKLAHGQTPKRYTVARPGSRPDATATRQNTRHAPGPLRDTRRDTKRDRFDRNFPVV